MPTAQVIGVDLGGTAIKLARIRADGTVLAETQCPTPQPAVPGAVTMALCDAIEQIDPEHAACLLYTSPSPRDLSTSRMPSSA